MSTTKTTTMKPLRNLTTLSSIWMVMSQQTATWMTRLAITMEWSSALETVTMTWILGQGNPVLQNMEGKVVSGSIVVNKSEQITLMPHRPMVIRCTQLIEYAGTPGMGLNIH